MKKLIFIFSTLLISLSHINAQEFNVHLNTGAEGFTEGEIYPVLGFGIEAKASKRWTVFGEFDYGSKMNSSLGGFLVDRSMYSIQPGIRRYFKNNMSGFNLSFYGTYARETIDPQENNTLSPSQLSSDRTGLGIGLGYVARLSNNLTLGFDSGLANTFDDDSGRFHLRLQLGYTF